MPKVSKTWIEILGGNKWYFGKRNNKLKMTAAQLGKALSQINRFGGHTDARLPYTVAQHSVFVSKLLDDDPKLAMAGLLHDAPEMIIGDIPSPVKAWLGEERFKPFREEEARVLRAVCKTLEVKVDIHHPRVKEADLVALVTEKRDLLSPDIEWGYFDEIERSRAKIVPKRPETAAYDFEVRFDELKDRLAQS